MSDQKELDPRLYFAAERIFLAWIRTGLALMGFGFVVARFGLFLRNRGGPRRRRAGSRLLALVRRRPDRLGGAADRRGDGVARLDGPAIEQRATLHWATDVARHHPGGPPRHRRGDDDQSWGVEPAITPRRLSWIAASARADRVAAAAGKAASQRADRVALMVQRPVGRFASNRPASECTDCRAVRIGIESARWPTRQGI